MKWKPFTTCPVRGNGEVGTLCGDLVIVPFPERMDDERAGAWAERGRGGRVTGDEAESCRETDTFVPRKVPDGLTLEEVQDFLSIPRTEHGLQEGEVECSAIPAYGVVS